MPRVAYIARQFGKLTAGMIEQANAIIDEYTAQGFQLTLRQLYYQFVARELIPNTMRSYKRLGSIVNDARLAGLIDWQAIEDRTRNRQALPHWLDPADIVTSCASQFRIDKWAAQPLRVEVWIEKEALVGVIAGACQDLDVPYFACRGYVSQSEMWAAAQRFRQNRRTKQFTVVLHLGDHDPSGIDMSRDIAGRLEMFKAPVRVERIALNIKQVEQYHLPPNPAKMTDSRAEDYIEKFGADSWELDALEPVVLVNLIRRWVRSHRDDAVWDKAVAVESDMREQLSAVSAKWPQVLGVL